MKSLLPLSVRINLLTASLCLVSTSTFAAKADLKKLNTTAVKFFERHCYECHDDESKKGDLDLYEVALKFDTEKQTQQWAQIFERVASGEMPPKKKKRHDASAKAQFLAELEAPIAEADKKYQQVTFRRLNRYEYENTIRDLFGIDIDLADHLPEDARAHGFDNIGQALAVSTELIGAYLKTADLALDVVFGPEKKAETKKWKIDLKDNAKLDRVLGKLLKDDPEGIVMFSSSYSPTNFRGFLPKEPGRYHVKLRVRAVNSEQALIMRVYAGDVIAGRGEKHLVGHYKVAPGKDWTIIEFEDRFERYNSVKVVPYRNGGHEKNATTTDRPGILVGKAEMEGPLDAWPPTSRTKLLGNIDLKTADHAEAEKILARFLPRAFRRKTTTKELQLYSSLFAAARKQKRSFTDSLRVALKAILVSPEFLFLDEPTFRPGRISEYALASRLSYFLWSSMPDNELLALAARRELKKPDILRKQTERMLKDPKSQSFTENFTGQWLELREIDFTEPDKKLYPEFDEFLKVSMVEETRRFFQEILDKDLSLLDFIDSDWLILNERLAEHYDIDGVNGLEYRKVPRPKNSVRGGVLTQASVLKVTANGTNTSPVLRGVWILDRIMGKPAPPPPTGVPAVEPDIRGAVTLREQLAKHRNDKSCAVCHVNIDPPGFALESFNVIGGWRENYRSLGEGKRLTDLYVDKYNHVRVRYKIGLPVDATGTTPDGKAFTNIIEFKKLLLRDQKNIAHGITEKLITYAIGRRPGFSDRTALHNLVNASEKENYKFRSLIHEIVQSPIFCQP